MRPDPTHEGKLIGEAAGLMNLSIREAARRAGISYGRWRQIVTGVQNISPGVTAPVRAPAKTVAKMAQVVGVSPERLAEEGNRPDAADELREMLRREEAGRAERLGLQFMSRRAALDPRYQDKRDTFTAERRIDSELARDIEFGRRANFTPDEAATIEDAYKLPTGALARALESGQLEPAGDETPAGDAAWPVTVIAAAASPAEREVRAQLARYPDSAPAEAIFADEVERLIWRQKTKTRDQKILQIAALRTVSRATVTRRVS